MNVVRINRSLSLNTCTHVADVQNLFRNCATHNRPLHHFQKDFLFALLSNRKTLEHFQLWIRCNIPTFSFSSRTNQWTFAKLWACKIHACTDRVNCVRGVRCGFYTFFVRSFFVCLSVCECASVRVSSVGKNRCAFRAACRLHKNCKMCLLDSERVSSVRISILFSIVTAVFISYK